MAGSPVQDEYAELADLYESSADPKSLNYVRPSPPISPDDELVGPGAPEPRFSADRLAQQYEAGPLDENTLAEWVQLTARQNRKREAPERLPKQFAARFPVLGEEFFEQGAGADTPRAAFQRWHDIYRRANDYAGTGSGADVRAKRAAERDAAELDQEGLEMLAFAVNDLVEAERPALRASYGVKVARGLSRGGMAVAEGARRMSRPFSFLQTQPERRQRGLQEGMEDRAAELMGIREQADPLTGGMEGGSFLTPEGWKGFASGKFAVQAAEQIPTQAASTALDVLTGGTSRIPQVAFWYDQIKPDEVRALRRMGVNQKRAEQLGSVSALLQAMIETIEKNPLLPKKASEAMGEFGKKQVRKIVSGAAKRYGKELSEEYLQGVVSESTRTLAEAIEKKVPGVGRFMLGRIGEIHGGALQQAAEAAGPLALMMGPTGVVQARMESRGGYSVKQLDDLMRGAMTLDQARATDPDAKYRPYEFVGPPTPPTTEFVSDPSRRPGDEAELFGPLPRADVRRSESIIRAADELYPSELQEMRQAGTAENKARDAASLSMLGNAAVLNMTGVPAEQQTKIEKIVRAEARKAIPADARREVAIRSGKKTNTPFIGREEAASVVPKFIDAVAVRLDRAYPDIDLGRSFRNLADQLVRALPDRHAVFRDAGNLSKYIPPTQEQPNAQESPPEAGQVREEGGAQGQAEEGVRVRDAGQAEAQERVLKPDTAAAKDELDAALLDFLREGKLFSNPLDPKLLALGARVVRSAVKLGTLKFRDFLTQLAQRIGTRAVRATAGLWEQVWNDTRASDKRLDEAKDAQAISDAMPDQEPAEGIGRPDLANPTVSEQAREVSRVTQELIKAGAISDETKDADVTRVSDALLSADYEGEKNRLIEAGQSGTVLTAEQTAVARAILERENFSVLANPEKYGEAIILGAAYQRTGTAWSKAGRARIDRVETPEQRNRATLTEAIVTPPKKVRIKLQKALERGDQKTINAIVEEQKKRLEKLLRALNIVGLGDGTYQGALDALGRIIVDDIAVARAIMQIAASKGDISDRFYEAYINFILSGPQTAIANFVGNTMHTGWYYTVEHFVEAALASTVFRRVVKNDAAAFSDYKWMLRAVIPKLAHAQRNAMLTWQTEMPWLDRMMMQDQSSKYDDDSKFGPAIPGKLGRGIRGMGWRHMQAVDQFNKTLIVETQAAIEAEHIADKMGLKGRDKMLAIARQTRDPRSVASQRAFNLATELVFQLKPSKLAALIQRGKRTVPGMRWVALFVTIIDNIFRLGVRKSPFGSFKLFYRMLKAGQTGDWSGIPRLAAEQVIAWAATLAIFCSNDPDDPWLTGAIPIEGRNQFEARLFGEPFNYGRIEPFATAIAVTADFGLALKRPGSAKNWKAPFQALIEQVRNKWFMQGIADIVNILHPRPGQDSIDEIFTWASDFMGGWFPNLFQQVGRSLRSFTPERRLWGEGEDYAARLVRRGLQGLEISPVVNDQPKVDLWGRDMQAVRSPIPFTDFFYRLLVPTRAPQDRDTIADRVMRKWNAAVADGKELHPQPPQRYIEIRGQKRWMNDEEYHEYSVLAGRIADAALNKGLLNAENPTQTDIDMITSALSAGRRIAADLLFRRGESTPRDFETFVAAQGQAVKLELFGSTIGRLVDLKPASVTDSERSKGLTKEEKQADWQTKRDAAAEWLRNRGMTQAEARELYRAYLQDSGDIRRITTATGRQEKINDRIRAFNRAWRQNVEQP